MVVINIPASLPRLVANGEQSLGISVELELSCYVGSIVSKGLANAVVANDVCAVIMINTIRGH